MTPATATPDAPATQQEEIALFREYRELADDALDAIVADPPGDLSGRVAGEVLAERAQEFDAAGEGSKAEEVQKEGGKSTGKMQKAPAEKPAPPERDEIQVDGTTQLELFDVGGKKPTKATVKFTGGKVKIVSGQAFKKGTRIKFSGEAIVNELTQKDEHDPQTGIVTDCEQRHGARIVDLVVESAG